MIDSQGIPKKEALSCKTTASYEHEVLMKWTLAERMLLRVAADAHQFTPVFHHPNTSSLPRGAKIVLSVGKRAVVGVATAAAVLVVPTQSHLVREALKTEVTDLPASKANHSGTARLHEAGYGASMNLNMYLSSNHSMLVLIHTTLFFKCVFQHTIVQSSF